MKKVISISIFNGSGIKNRQGFYWVGLVSLIRGYLSIFPDWEIWIYHDSSLYSNFYGSVLLSLAEKNLVKLIYVKENEPLCKAMLWRLSPVFDDSVDYVLCRDTDHVPTGKERAIVDKFISSGSIALGINDNDAHTIPLMGGLIGFKSKEMKKKLQADSLDDLLNKVEYKSDFSNHGSDQTFLMKVIFPLVREDMFMYSKVRRGYYSSMKHCYDKIDIVPISGISEKLLKESENYCDFMGTASNQLPAKYNQFVNINGNPDTIRILIEAEKKAFVDVLADSRYDFTLSSTNKKKVILSCNFNLDYLFYLPIVTLLWQKYTGFQPIVYLVGALKRWLSPSIELFVIKEARKLGAEINFLPYISEYKDSTITQLSRLYAACSVMYPNSYFLTSDVDMLPLSSMWFNLHHEGKTVDIKYPECCGPGNYPICYVGASSVIWREIMGLKLDTEVSIENQIEQQLKQDIGAGGDSFVEWCYDEALLSRKIRGWKNHPDSCQIITRPGCPPGDRVDRSCWPTNLEDISRFVDCHSLRPGHTPENWVRLRQLLALKLNKEDLELVDRYHQRFMERIG